MLRSNCNHRLLFGPCTPYSGSNRAPFNNFSQKYTVEDPVRICAGNIHDCIKNHDRQ